ncbi:hypothetical protein EB816_06930 [Streptococcus pyogenes]|uniref:Uncharacterized protein n=1 Tax=Streptococcus pyogenes TaxID=1314 RepID=A0A5S4TK72_STRPY|nr:hypothetical protein HMPREF1244_1262 [Streptococcus pyogenes GA19702]QAX69666.1 hypothetical protein EB816_06930 [Streptococcus pyogenes]QAX70834.1 hypothetical protein EB817_03185 [Streptococcus pyogenes]TYK85878.1 hypothetical protein E0F64_05420 [Streptococcus pyogenes]TYK94683.1 hypothetical protein E0F67_06180 [Streptococcus pyogenes]
MSFKTDCNTQSFVYFYSIHPIDGETDSIRFYLLGKNWQRRVETLGRSDSYDPDKGVLLL